MVGVALAGAGGGPGDGAGATSVRSGAGALAARGSDILFHEAVRALTAAGVSYRDIAELLGLSHQRVAQIARAS